MAANAVGSPEVDAPPSEVTADAVADASPVEGPAFPGDPAPLDVAPPAPYIAVITQFEYAGVHASSDPPTVEMHAK